MSQSFDWKKAAQRAVGGGLPGAAAMLVQVLALMWMRTAINYQHARGLSMSEALAALYAEGGIPRFYQGVWAAVLQAPLSRFGDTAANAGVLQLLSNVNMPIAAKTLVASVAAALFRIAISPVDTFKTMLQVRGAEGLQLIMSRLASEGVIVLYAGAIASSVATLMGHYPWFIVYNYLQATIPPATGIAKQLRSAVIGFCSSACSDTVSNSVRVLKTATQTATKPTSYLEAAQGIIATDGVRGLLFRGLTTKIISNGLQAMLFTVLWRYFEEKLAAYNKKNDEAATADAKKK